MAFKDWNESASLNSSVGGVNIAEGSARADTNDAIRAMMAELRTRLKALAVYANDEGVVGNGSTDDTAALTTNIASVVSRGGGWLVISGTPLVSSTVTIPDKVSVLFIGSPGNFSGARPTSYLVKKSTMTTVALKIEGQSVSLVNGGVVAQPGATGPNIQITGNDVRWRDGYSEDGEDISVRVGEDSTATPNTNGTILDGFCIDTAGTIGLLLHDGNAPGDYPNGNVGSFRLRIRNSGSDAIKVDNAFGPSFRDCIIETNAGKGINITARAVSVLVDGGDFEVNSGGAGIKGSDIYVAPTEKACTFQIAADTVTLALHGIADGTPIKYTVIDGTTGISVATVYYTRDATTNTFKVAATSGGAAINLATADGTGSFYQLGAGGERGGHSIHPATCGTPVEYGNTYGVSVQGPNLSGFGADSGSYPVYSEGTFTPVLAGSGTAGTNAYTTQFGFYTKTGRKVDAWVDIKMNGQSVAMVGSLTIPNMPFGIKSGSPVTAEWGFVDYLATNAARIGLGCAMSGKVLTFYSHGDADGEQAVVVDAAQGVNFVASGRIIAKFSYITTD